MTQGGHRQAHAEDVSRGAGPGHPGGDQARPRFSRRQAIGRMSAVATAGAAAWVVPEILTAKPAAGASLSGTGGGAGAGAAVSTSASAGTPGDGVSASGGAGVSTDPGSSGGTAPASAPATLAFTGLDIERDAEVGAALVAGGWAMHHWASRRPKLAAARDGRAAGHEPRSAGQARGN